MNETIINALKEGRLYDYVANNYWDMSRETLKDIILELYYAMDCNTDAFTKERIVTDMSESLSF